MFHNRKSGRAKQRLHDVLVHARGRSKHPSAHVWNICKFEKPLNGAVFAECPMQHGEDYVHIDRAISSTSSWRIGLKWCQPSPRFMRLRWNHHGLTIVQNRG